MKIKSLVAVAAIASLSFACGAKYAKVKIKDKDAGSAHVYGDIDGPPKQLKNTYPSASPETMEKATKFRALVESELVSAKK
jgi:hypothetical protein